MVVKSDYRLYYQTSRGQVIKCAAVQLIENELRQLTQVCAEMKTIFDNNGVSARDWDRISSLFNLG